MSLQSVKVASLRPNPFRELDDYPIDREKVDALKESILSTGFWGTVVARKVGSEFQIAFGHHRTKAMDELIESGDWPKSAKVDIIVRDLTNEQMVKMMARENLAEYGTNAYVEAQTVESTIRAYGAGEIELPELSKDTRRDAVRNVSHASGTRHYTVQQVAEFLGWTRSHGERGVQPNHCCRVAFEMLDAFDAGVVRRKQLIGVKRDVAREIVTKAMSLKREQDRIAKERRKQAAEAEALAQKEENAKHARKLMQAADELERQAEIAEKTSQKVAKDFATEAVKRTKSGDWAQRDVREAGTEAKTSLRSNKEKAYREAKEYYDALSRQVCRMLNESADDKFKSLVDLLKMDCGLEPHHISVLLVEVEALQNRAEQFTKKLRAWKEPKRADAGSSGSLRIVG